MPRLASDDPVLKLTWHVLDHDQLRLLLVEDALQQPHEVCEVRVLRVPPFASTVQRRVLTARRRDVYYLAVGFAVGRFDMLQHVQRLRYDPPKRT